MELGVHCANLTWPGGAPALADTLRDVAVAADQGGAKTLTMMDHYFQMENLGGPPEPMLEGYTSLGFLAGQTENVELGLLVTGVTYRHPGLLAKIVSTLDVLSRGRAMLGIGAAWYDREHRGFGVPFPPTKERFERLEEAIQICRAYFSGDAQSFEGHHYQLAEITNVPQVLHQPRLLIGGVGERKTLRLVAQYADATNLFAQDVDFVRHKLDVLKGHCDDLGRDYEAIDKTIVATLGDPFGADFLPAMAEYAALGINQVWVGPDAEDPVRWTERVCGEVLPRLREL